jgi:surface antigen
MPSSVRVPPKERQQDAWRTHTARHWATHWLTHGLARPDRIAGCGPPSGEGVESDIYTLAIALAYEVPMNRTLARIIALTPIAVGLGCSAEALDDVAVTRAALSVCEEDVPADRNVDGIPSYAQCDASESSAIYSNNGVDTSTEKLGDDWVRTQWSGGYQCTELAHRYLYFKWDIDWLPNGNAGEWCDETPPSDSGMVQTDTPVHGDIMVLAGGSCGAAQSTGHVTVVDVVGASGELTVVEQNGARRGRYEQSCAKCFLHVVANTGEGGASGIGGAGGDGGASGMGGAGGSSGMSGIVPPAGGMSGGGGGGGTSGAGGLGGVGGASGMDGAGGMMLAGAGGMMSVPPIAGAGAVGGGGAGGMMAVAGAQAMPASNFGASEPESCGVARAGGTPSALHWSTLGIVFSALLLVLRRSTRRARA